MDWVELFDSSMGLPSSQRVGPSSTRLSTEAGRDVTLGRGKSPFLSLLSLLYSRFPFLLRAPGLWSPGAYQSMPIMVLRHGLN